HTYRCKHATQWDESYVKAAVRAHFDELGFSDHSPWPYPNKFRSFIRMDNFMLDDYIESLTELKQRYKDVLSIKIGLECEYFDDYMPWLTEQVEARKLDYVIFGNHFYKDDSKYPEYFGHSIVDKENLEIYLESILKGMEYKKFAYVAHPDLFINSYKYFDVACEKASRQICEKAYKLGLPLEFNLSGYRIRGARHTTKTYPYESFWKIAADCGCTCIIGYDAHDPKYIASDAFLNKGLKEIKKLGLKRIERIGFLTDK
ncbi:MAG: histidinol-phosphatase, partial [Oscillospiraceae bacterium]